MFHSEPAQAEVAVATHVIMILQSGMKDKADYPAQIATKHCTVGIVQYYLHDNNPSHLSSVQQKQGWSFIHGVICQKIVQIVCILSSIYCQKIV